MSAELGDNMLAVTYRLRKEARAMLPLIVASLIAGLSAIAEGDSDRLDWYWDSPREHYNTVLAQAEPGRIVGVGLLAVLDNGDLVTSLVQQKYMSDAVGSDWEGIHMRSRDGGITWEKTQPSTSDILYTAARLPDGTLLASSSCGYENFPDTEEKRNELTEQGYYLFTPEMGNAPGVISIIHRAWMSRSTDGGQTWQKSNIQLPSFKRASRYAMGPTSTRWWGGFTATRSMRLAWCYALKTAVTTGTSTRWPRARTLSSMRLLSLRRPTAIWLR